MGKLLINQRDFDNTILTKLTKRGITMRAFIMVVLR